MHNNIVRSIKLRNSLSRSKLNKSRVLPLLAPLFAFLLISVVSATGCSSSSNNYPPILPNERPEDKPYTTIIEDFQVIAPSLLLGSTSFGPVASVDEHLLQGLLGQQ